MLHRYNDLMIDLWRFKDPELGLLSSGSTLKMKLSRLLMRWAHTTWPSESLTNSIPVTNSMPNIPGVWRDQHPAARSMRIWNSRVRAGLSTTRENAVSFYNLDILILECFSGRGEMMRDRFGYVAYYRRGARIDHLFHSPAISTAADQEWRIRRGCNTARLSSGIGWLSLLRDFLSVKRKRRLVRLKIVECINRST